MLRDLKNNLSVATALAPKARTASENGGWIDLQGVKSAMFIFEAGAWTDGTHTPNLQDADASDQSDSADVDASLVEGAFTAVASSGDANKAQRVGYKGVKRYVRVVVTCAGTTTGALSSAVAVTEPLAKPAP